MPLTLSGSIDLTGSIIATRGFTGSLQGTASYALQGALGSIRTTGSTIYSYDPSTTGVNTTESIFLGLDAGYNATAANNSVFLSTGAGYAATNAANSNFIGYNAGKNATNADSANFIGYQSGQNATNAQYSNFIGINAGIDATNAIGSNFIGLNAGYLATNAISANFIGNSAGDGAYSASYSNYIGQSAGLEAINAAYSNFIGVEAGRDAIEAPYSNFIGRLAGQGAVSSSYSNFIGYNAGLSASAASSSNFIGYNAGAYSINASYSTFIGYNAGYEATNGPRSVGINNIIIGTNITLPSGSRDSINIGGVIFATGSYGTTTGNPFSGSVQSARVGINRRTPVYTLDVSGSGNFTNTLTVTGSITVVTGSSSVMGTKQYEPLTVERSGDLKMGVYTTVTNFASGGAALALGYSSVTASSTYYPGFEMQMVGNVTQSQNRLRFNSLERNSAGLVLGSYNDILTVYDNGRVVLNASLSGTKTGGNGSQLILGASSSAYTFDVTGSGNFRGALTVTSSVTINDVLVLPPVDPLPTGRPTGSFAVSGSDVNCKPYFYNGATWTALF